MLDTHERFSTAWQTITNKQSYQNLPSFIHPPKNEPSENVATSHGVVLIGASMEI